MISILNYGRWILSGAWVWERPSGASVTWGRLVASWTLSTFLVAAVFVLLVAGGFLSGVGVALLFPLAQAAILLGLAYAARIPRRIS